MVHGKPFVLLAGEVHNSNASSPAYMEQVWQQADRPGMNSLLLPIGWDMVEPREDQFDFSLVDSLLEQARRYGKKMVLLWFGAWKNAQFYYAPPWIKTQPGRFWRAQVIQGQSNAKVVQWRRMQEPLPALWPICARWTGRKTPWPGPENLRFGFCR